MGMIITTLKALLLIFKYNFLQFGILLKLCFYIKHISPSQIFFLPQ